MFHILQNAPVAQRLFLPQVGGGFAQVMMYPHIAVDTATNRMGIAFTVNGKDHPSLWYQVEHRDPALLLCLQQAYMYPLILTPECVRNVEESCLRFLQAGDQSEREIAMQQLAKQGLVGPASMQAWLTRPDLRRYYYALRKEIFTNGLPIDYTCLPRTLIWQ